MEVFQLTVDVMLMMFTLIIAGYLLRKFKILPEGSEVTMARLETYALVPALNFHNWATNCTVETMSENWTLIIYGLVIALAAMAVSYPLSRLFVRNFRESAKLEYERNIYKYAMTFSNFGFMGNFIILGVFGSEGLFRYLMFTMSMNFIVASWGVYILVPKGNIKSKAALLKNIFTPPTIGMFAGGIVGITGLTEKLPDFLLRAAENASNCMGPVAMILAGFVVGGYEFRTLLGKKKVYVATLFRLIVIPSVLVTVLYWLGINKEIITLALIAYATPLGLNTIVYPATYGGETMTGAAMAMISHTLSVVTIPLMYYVFIVTLF